MITRKSRHEITLMRAAGKIVAEALLEMKNAVKPGISTAELNSIAEHVILKNNAIPAFKGYHGFPATICSSINEEVVHGIPSSNIILKEGDIISLDVGATYKGLVGDSAITVGVGNISDEVQMLLDVTKQALYYSIEQIKPNCDLQNVSGAIQDKANEHGLGIVTQYGGHGIGRNMHEEPFVFNYRTNSQKVILKSGMTIAIEPMFNLGTGDVHVLSDGWTVVTNDGKPSAHFEHTILVTDSGYEILTVL